MPALERAAAHRWFLLALTAFAATRLLVNVAALATPVDPARSEARAPWWSPLPLVRWDAGHYRRILTAGYPCDLSDTAAFFPGYPLATWPLAQVFDADLALVATSHVAALFGVVLFFDWCRRLADARTAFWSVALLSCFPTAIFLSAAYAEGVFLACVAATLWLLERGRTWPAAAACAFASLTRPTGLALAAVVALWDLLRTTAVTPGPDANGQRMRVAGAPRCTAPARAGTPRPRRWARAALVGLVASSGFAGFSAYLVLHYQRLDAPGAVQAFWLSPPNRHPWVRALTLQPVVGAALKPVRCLVNGPWAELAHPRTWNQAINLTIVVLALAGLRAPGPVPRLAFLFPLLVFLMAYLPDPVSGGRMIGIARYQLVALPCFLLAAHRLVERGWTVALAALAALMLAMQCGMYAPGFVNWILVS